MLLCVFDGIRDKRGGIGVWVRGREGWREGGVEGGKE